MSSNGGQLTLLAALALGLASCGASTPGQRSVSTDPALGARAAEQASLAWSQLDPARALSEAERAARLGQADAATLEVGARAALASGELTRGRALLADTQDATLLGLRARLAISAVDFSAAASDLRAASRAAREDDPWAASILPALEALGESPYEVSGAAGAPVELALEPAALPVVAVRVDTRDTLAVVSTGVGMTVLDPSVRASAGAIDELGLGAIRVRSVPHTVRSLEDVREALGLDIGMVLGADLLLRLRATLDGPGRRLVLHTEAPQRPEATTAPLLTLSGSFLAVPAAVEGEPGWLTVDSAGLYPIALSEAGVAAYGLEALEWAALEESGDGPSLRPVTARIGALEVEDLPAVRGLIGPSHAAAVRAPVAGAIGWTLLSQLSITFDADGRVLRFEE